MIEGNAEVGVNGRMAQTEKRLEFGSFRFDHNVGSHFFRLKYKLKMTNVQENRGGFPAFPFLVCSLMFLKALPRRNGAGCGGAV